MQAVTKNILLVLSLAIALTAVAAPVCAIKPNPDGNPSASDVLYDIRDLSESEVMNMYESMMLDACRFSDASWHAWSVDPLGGWWGNGISTGNEGIRVNGSMLINCATLLKYCDTLTPAERQNYLAKWKSALRYVVSTHKTGTRNCVDGLKWGGDWQSALWASSIALGSWLIWDDLDPDQRQGVETVVAYEADRFLVGAIPSGHVGDTKAEENGWNLSCISIAANMFAAHPHAAAWDEKAKEYMMNTISVAHDEQDSTLVDGKSVREWVCTENVYPDFTLENHNILHPSYAGSFHRLPASVMYSIYAGRPVPRAATHHVMDTWRMYQTMVLPTGELAYPQGMDWELHNLPSIHLFATMATYMRDPVAAEKEKSLLQYIRQWQQWGAGSLTLPGSSWGFCRHALMNEGISLAYLAHKVHGPATQNAPVYMPFVKHYSYVDMTLHRTQSKLVSFSWKNRFMGMVMPIGAGHEDNPFFTVPTASGFVGSTTLTSGGTAVSLLAHALSESPNGFETTGTLLTNSGLLKQLLRVSSVGEKTVVYQDSVSALSNVTVTKELGVPIGIENDSLTGGTRSVSYEGSQTVFNWATPKATTAIPGSWANVDGRLGVVNVTGSGMAYSQATGYTSGIAVYSDMLYGSYSSVRRSFKSGDQAARRIVVFFTEVTPAETAALAQSVRLENGPNGQVLRFSLPEGGEGSVSTSLGPPTISPSTPIGVVRGAAAPFTFSPSSGSVTWQVIDESRAPGSVGSIDATGLFTGVGIGTCRVRAADSTGAAAVSGLVTVVSPGAYNYAPDADTVALYHLDETMGNTWLDSGGNSINATASASYPVAHVIGVFGNAAGEFRWTDTSASLLTTSASTAFQTPEMTAECWVYFPPGVDILAATANGSIRGILGCRAGGNSWSLCAGSWPNGTNPPYGVPGGVCFVYWGTPASVFASSPQRVFYSGIWYHVAATYKPLATTPATYEVKVYVTPLGTTSPVLVAHAVTANKMATTATRLYIGGESATTARKFPGYIDEVRISNRARTSDELKWTLGGITAQSLSIGQARSQMADGVYVSLAGAVSASFADCCYLEAMDRSAGIKMDSGPFLGFGMGDVGIVVGKLGTMNSERFLQPTHIEKTGELAPVPALPPTAEITPAD